jgi:hypothetical protein
VEKLAAAAHVANLAANLQHSCWHMFVPVVLLLTCKKLPLAEDDAGFSSCCSFGLPLLLLLLLLQSWPGWCGFQKERVSLGFTAAVTSGGMVWSHLNSWR